MGSPHVRLRDFGLIGLLACLLPAFPVSAADNEFRFIVLADLHIGQNDDVFQTRYDEMVREIADSLPKPKAVFAIGDITDHGRAGEYDQFLACFVDPLKAAGIPLYAIPGSRDIAENTLAVWTNKLGAPYQAVTLEKTRFILTCGVPGDTTGRPASQGGMIDSNQLAWIRLQLDAPETRAAAVVVMLNHFPLWADDFGGVPIQDVDAAGTPTDAAKNLRAWMDNPGVDLFLCGNRHFQAPPILHEHPSGKQTWHVLNESAVLGRTSKIPEAKGKTRTMGGCGFQIFDVSGTRIDHFRKTLDAAGYAHIGPLNRFTLALRPPAPPSP